MILAPEQCGCPLKDTAEPSVATSGLCNGVFLFMILIESYLRGRCQVARPCERIDSVEELKDEYDFIVVGAGPAGSVVASRLSENDTNNVLLLEEGPEEPIGAKVPSFYRAFWNAEEVNYLYRTVPGDYCHDQKGKGCFWPRGKVVGGSNVLNGMMYHRGHAADYEEWVNAGAAGWSWEENRKYFDMTEGNQQIGSLVKGEYHSDKGPLPVQQFRYQPPFMYELMNAINASDLPIIADINDPDTPEGFAIAQAMTNDGQRWTAARAFLKPRSNLNLKTRTRVTRVLIDGNNHAYGVEYIDQDGSVKTLKANKEVILSAGALNTPQILMHSGVGPAETLQRYNIPVVADLPVGKNLRNHLGMTFYYLIKNQKNSEILDWSAFTNYILKLDGPMSSTALTQLTGLLYSSLAQKSKNQPDLQIFFNGFYAECSRTGSIDEPVGGDDCYLNGRNISVNTVAIRPRSVGYVTLNSSDPREPLLFYPEFFAHPDDMVMIKEGARHVQNIFNTTLMRDHYDVQLDPEYIPQSCKQEVEWSDPWIECMARYNTDPQNHQAGTASIGAVIDPQLKVYNVTSLRVADASSMPTVPTGNPQAAIMMVAERAAALIKRQWS